MELGRLGVWNNRLRSLDRAQAAEVAGELEELGYTVAWLGSSPGVEEAVPLLEGTSSLVVATGILNIWEHAAGTVAAQAEELEKDHPGRFVLGLGVSHARSVGDRYARPYRAMIDYLDRLDEAGSPAGRRVLAALGPRMLEAARDRAAGAHPYLVTSEHTRRAREILGAGSLLAPEVKVVLDRDLDRARSTARGHLNMYLQLPNYTSNLLRLGFSEADVQGPGSDRLIDSVFAIGDVDTIDRRLGEHFEAGADHLAIQVITADRYAIPLQEWRELAPLVSAYK